MVAELGISIESSFESNMEVKNSYASKEVKSNIKTTIAKIRISNYEVVSFEKMRYNETVVLVRSDKKKFSEGLEKSLVTKVEAINEEKKAVKGSHRLEQYNTYVKLDAKAKDLLSEVMVLSSVDRTFDHAKYMKFIAEITKELSDIKRNLKFYVVGDRDSEVFETELKNYLTGKGLNLASKANGENIEIRINTKVKIDKISDSMQLSVFLIDIKAFSDKKRIGGKSLVMKERYSGSLNTSFKSASIHFAQDIKKQETEEIIGLTIQ
jgi:RNase H-fold protein (predicted Holliday junction resolvase)